MPMEKKLLLQKRNAMRKTNAETGCGNSALVSELDYLILFA